MSEVRHHLQDAAQEESTLTPKNNLEPILFKFITLYESWLEECQVMEKQGEDIEKFVKKFSLAVNQFSMMEGEVVGKLQKGLDQVTAGVAEQVRGAVSHAVNQSLDDSGRRMRDAAIQAEHIISRYQSLLSWSHFKFFVITAFSSIAASLLIVWWLIPTPTLPLKDAQIATYQNGLMLNSFWGKLSERQKKWLFNIAKGKSNNNEKLVEDMKKQYPDMSDE